jgi:hypothetical protein
MATSGTTTFTLTRDDIITYALSKCGVLELGTTPDATTVSRAATILEMLIKSLVAKGSKLWTIQELTLPLVASQTNYNIGPTGSTTPLALVTDKPLALLQAWIRNISVTPQNDIPLTLLSLNDYNTLGSKGSTGTPNSIELQVLRDYSIAKLYVTPSSFEAGIYQVHLLVKRAIQDAGISTNNLDFPAEWLYALGWSLAAELIADYDLPPQKAQYIEMKAAKALMEMEDFDTEQSSVFFTPTSRWTR